MTINYGSLRQGTNNTIELRFQVPRTIRANTDSGARNANNTEAPVPAARRLRGLLARFYEALCRSRMAQAKRVIAHYRRLTR